MKDKGFNRGERGFNGQSNKKSKKEKELRSG